MPYFQTAQAFLEQSQLLVSARPTTTRISTKYNIPHPNPPPCKYKPKSQIKSEPEDPSSQNPVPPSIQDNAQSKATLTLKTYDPVSGVCLKYQTDKGVEVGRLVAALSRCGRVMAGLPNKEEGAMEVDAGIKEEVGAEPEAKAKIAVSDTKAPIQSKGGEKAGGGGGGGGGKKKKGKR
ncbi:hypothetical protein ACLMJK_000897 [Lecanora helva]